MLARNFMDKCKHFRKKRKQHTFIDEVKIFQLQTALYLPTLLQLQVGQGQLNSNNTQEKYVLASQLQLLMTIKLP